MARTEVNSKQIRDESVTLADMQKMPAKGFIGNSADILQQPQHLTVSEAKSLLGVSEAETPQSILDKIKQVDGAGSGLDADLLDGFHASDFAKSGFGPGELNLSELARVPNTCLETGLYYVAGTAEGGMPVSTGDGTVICWSYNQYHKRQMFVEFSGTQQGRIWQRGMNSGSWSTWRQVATEDMIPSSLPANGGNADTLDGLHASDFAKKVNYNSVVGDNGQDAWYDFFSLNDATSSIVSCLINCYAHTSVSFTVSVGYNGASPTIFVTNYNFNSTNADYKYIKGIRLLRNESSVVMCQIKLNSGASVSITGHLISNTTPNVFSTLNRYTGSGTVLETIEPLRYGVSTTGEFYSHHNKVWHEGNDGHGSNLDADLLDGSQLSDITPFKTIRDFALGTLIKTTQDFSASEGAPWLLEIKSNSYENWPILPLYLVAQGYPYGGGTFNLSGVAYSHYLNDLKLFCYEGKLCFWFPRQGYWKGYQITVTQEFSGQYKNIVSDVVDSDKPVSITKELSIPIAKTWNSVNDGPGSTLDADTLDGKQASDFIDYVGSDSGAVDVNDHTDAKSIIRVGTVQNWTNKPPFAMSNAGAFINLITHPGQYRSQLWFNTDAEDMYLRSVVHGYALTWHKVWHDGNSFPGVKIANFGGNSDSITTAQFITMITSMGAFTTNYWRCRSNWSYADNQIITDTGCGNIHLAGAIVEVTSQDTGAYTIKVTTAPTSGGGSNGIVNTEFIYRNHGAEYSPNWTRTLQHRDETAFHNIFAKLNDSPTFTGDVSARSFYGVNWRKNDIKTNSDLITLEEIALMPSKTINNIRFFPSNKIIAEESTNGTSWVESTRISSNDLTKMTIGEGQTISGMAIPNLTIGAKGYYRLTFNYDGYRNLDFLNINCSTNGNLVNVKIEKHAYGASDSTWELVAQKDVNNWPGSVFLHHDAIWWNENAGQHDKVRITFESTDYQETWNLGIFSIEWFGWYPNGSSRNLYEYANDKSIIFPYNVNTASNFNATMQGSGLYLKDETTAIQWHLHSHGDRLRTFNGSVEKTYVAQKDSFTTPKITFDSEYDPTELYVNGAGHLIFNEPVDGIEYTVFTTKNFSPSRLVNKDTPANTIEFIDGNGLQWNTGGPKYFNNRQVSSGTATSYHFQDGTNLINSPYADVYVGNLHTTNIDDMYQYRDNGISINNYMGAVDGSHTDIGGVSGYNFKIEDSHNSYDYIIGCNQVFSGYSEQKELLRLNVEKLVSQVPIEAPSITVPNHPQILYGTGTAPSASGLADGTMYIQYS